MDKEQGPPAGGDGLTNIEQARRTVQAERELRVRACWQEIRAALEKHRCDLVPKSQITQEGHVLAIVELVPKG